MPPPRHGFAAGATDGEAEVGASAAGHIFVTIDTRTLARPAGSIPSPLTPGCRIETGGRTRSAHEVTPLSLYCLVSRCRGVWPSPGLLR